MSILDFPRVNFRGIFKTNPCTANNDDVMPSVVTRDTNDLGLDLQGKSDNSALAYLNESVEMHNYDDPPGAKKFMRSGWNPSGDHFTSFENTTVQSVIYSAGCSAVASNQDALVGLGFEIIGSPNPSGSRSSGPIICDLDPTGLVSTQLFVGGIHLFQQDEQGNKTTIFKALHDTRGFQNWLNFCSTLPETGTQYRGEQNFVGIGCVWQFVVPQDKLPAYADCNLDSPGLEALLSAAQQAGGLAIRFRCYEVEPGYTDEYLSKTAKEQGFPAPNPAYGYLIGTIGIWNADEPQSETAGRKLEAHYRTADPSQYISPDDPDQGRPSMSWSSGPAQTATAVPGCIYPWMGAPALIGNAVALIQPDSPVISLDILESFPKYGFRNPNGPVLNAPPEGFDHPTKKAYVGEVELAVIPPGGGAPIPVADIEYGYNDYRSYEDFGGIVDLPFDANKVPRKTLANGQLILRGKTDSPLNAGIALVKESIIRVVTDDRTAYIAPERTDYPLRVKVYQRGGPTTQDVTLYLKEYKTVIQLKGNDTCASPKNTYRTNQSVDSRTEPITVADNPSQCPPSQPAPNRLTFPDSVTIPAGTTGWVTIPVSPNIAQDPNGGTAVFAFQQDENYTYGTIPPATPDGQPTLGMAGVPMWSTKNYCSVRVFGSEDFSALYQKSGGLQWSDVYEHALRYYYLLFPAMSVYIPLNYASSITSPYSASLIKQRLNTPDQPAFYSTLNMPVTRTLSPARVKLILDFIDQSQNNQNA